MASPIPVIPSDASTQEAHGFSPSRRDETIPLANPAREEVNRTNHEYNTKRKQRDRTKQADSSSSNDKSKKEAHKKKKLEVGQPLTINHDDVLKAMKWQSYDFVTRCSRDEHKKLLALLKGSIPVSFYSYSCLEIVPELSYHKLVHMWSERTVLTELFFSLLGFSEEQVLNDKSWKKHSLVEHDRWLSQHSYHCYWGGITCGFTTIGVGQGNPENTFDEGSISAFSVEECENSPIRSRHRNRCNGERNMDGWTCKPCPPVGSVTKIDITLLGLSGSLPDNLYMLTQLHRLNVMGNSIGGGIPDTYQWFQSLEFIDVSKNQMTDPLPDYLPTSLTELWYVKSVRHAFRTINLISYMTLIKMNTACQA